MRRDQHETDELTQEELSRHDGAELPPREAMSLVDIGGEGGLMPLPEPVHPGEGGPGAGGGEHTLPVEPPAAS